VCGIARHAARGDRTGRSGPSAKAFVSSRRLNLTSGKVRDAILLGFFLGGQGQKFTEELLSGMRLLISWLPKWRWCLERVIVPCQGVVRKGRDLWHQGGLQRPKKKKKLGCPRKKKHSSYRGQKKRSNQQQQEWNIDIESRRKNWKGVRAKIRSGRY